MVKQPGARRPVMRDRVAACAVTAGMILVAVAATGCGRRIDDKWSRSRPDTYPASGTVLVGGKPVAGVKVQFEQAAAGQQGPVMVAFGVTDSRGRFTLRTFRDGDGAVAGDHAVLIDRITYEPLPKRPGEEVATDREVSHLPEKYRSAKTSGLKATVDPAGRNEFSFAVEEK